MTEADLILAVRAACGAVTVAMKEVSDVDIARYGQAILRTIEEKITVKTVRYITSTIDIREYAVPDEVLRIQQVFPWSGIEELYDFGQTSVTVQGNTAGIMSDYEFPSLWKIKMMRKMRGLSRFSYEWDPINRKLKIDPAPSATGTKYYYKSVDKTKWTLALIPEDFSEMVITGTTWKSLTQIALKRANLGGQIRDGGSVTYPASELRVFAQDKKKEFDEALKLKTMIYTR